MAFFGRFFLDRETDIVVELFLENGAMRYVLRTPNHHSGNLITNLAGLCRAAAAVLWLSRRSFRRRLSILGKSSVMGSTSSLITDRSIQNAAAFVNKQFRGGGIG